jgi:hypothetical protein
MRRAHSFCSWQRRYERPGRASLGRRKETRDQRGGNLLRKKELRVSITPSPMNFSTVPPNRSRSERSRI